MADVAYLAEVIAERDRLREALQLVTGALQENVDDTETDSDEAPTEPYDLVYKLAKERNDLVDGQQDLQDEIQTLKQKLDTERQRADKESSRADQERERVEEEKRRADREKRRADQERQRADQES